ncbi:MAG TPA: shikimate dehydrogenase [Myxococcales bacterium]|nr:shikimate dehydrogenase [Myxococcales bacterium]
MRALYLLLGDPVAHSRSPAIHARAFSLLGVDAVYAPCRVARAAEGVAAARALGVAGFNVTVPHKEAVAELVDRIHPSAARIGAVNCVVRDGDALVGHNTDTAGLLRALRMHGVDPSGARAVVVGAGGSARAAAWALVPHASQITIVNRTESKARALAALVQAAGGKAITAPWGTLPEADLVVHCTTIGLSSNDVPFDPAALRRGCALVDLVYAPGGKTELLKRFSGKCIDGIDVLVHQAIASLEIWLGRPQLDHLAGALREAALA